MSPWSESEGSSMPRRSEAQCAGSGGSTHSPVHKDLEMKMLADGRMGTATTASTCRLSALAGRSGAKTRRPRRPRYVRRPPHAEDRLARPLATATDSSLSHTRA